MAELQQYLKTLESDPRNEAALQGLEEVFAAGAPAGADKALAELDRVRGVLLERGELGIVGRLFDIELATAEGERRADVLLAKGDFVLNDLLDDPGAQACFEEVLKLRENDETASDTVMQLEMEREHWQKFVQKNLDEASASTDRALTTHMYLSAAKFHGRYQADGKEAEDLLRKALDADPKNRKAAITLEMLLRKGDRLVDVDQLLAERAAIAATKEERVYALLRRAELAIASFDKPDVAGAMMNQVVAMEPANPQAMTSLAAAYEAKGDWSALVELYSGALKTRRRKSSKEEENQLLLRIARLHWQRLDQMDEAEKLFRRVRKADPLHRETLDFYRQYYLGKGEGAKLLQVLRQAQKAVPAGAKLPPKSSICPMK